MDEFEVHLLSTASVEIFGDNTMAAFKNQLPQNISLEGDWRVALSCLLYTSPSPRDRTRSRMPSSA